MRIFISQCFSLIFKSCSSFHVFSFFYIFVLYPSITSQEIFNNKKLEVREYSLILPLLFHYANIEGNEEMLCTIAIRIFY